MKWVKAVASWVCENWERVLFAVVGLVLLSLCFLHILRDKVTEAAVLFGLAFISFIYANVSRFKKFKGLGFEAELWEDKQKQAADLIERLRDVVSIYSTEILLGKVTAGRLSSGGGWVEHWKLYDDLVAQHSTLGQKIDLSNVKRKMDDFFLFDMTYPQHTKVRQAIEQGKARAIAILGKEFGSPITDSEGYARRLADVRRVPEPRQDPFEFSTQNDLAEHLLRVFDEARERLKRDFGVEIAVDAMTVERLTAISKLYQNRPVNVTSELIAWANRQDD